MILCLIILYWLMIIKILTCQNLLCSFFSLVYHTLPDPHTAFHYYRDISYMIEWNPVSSRTPQLTLPILTQIGLQTPAKLLPSVLLNRHLPLILSDAWNLLLQLLFVMIMGHCQSPFTFLLFRSFSYHSG